MKHLKISFVFLTLTCVCIHQAIECNRQQVNDESYIFVPRVKRQSTQGAVRGQISPKQQISTNSGGQVGSMAATMAASSNSGGGGGSINKPNDNDSLDKNNEEMFSSMNSDENLDARAKPKKPSKKKPANNHQEDSEEDCYYTDEDYREFDDYTGGIFRIATQPMRHFGRIMNDVFNQMPNYDNQQGNLNAMFPAGGSSAVAAASSSGDGVSRMLSSVTNNGRTRGIVSETRNGRTQTRRIERNNDEDNADYDDE